MVTIITNPSYKNNAYTVTSWLHIYENAHRSDNFVQKMSNITLVIFVTDNGFNANVLFAKKVDCRSDIFCHLLQKLMVTIVTIICSSMIYLSAQIKCPKLQIAL